jgi:hypothetical protein
MKLLKTKKSEAKKKKRNGDLPTVEVPVEYLRALHRAIGRRTDNGPTVKVPVKYLRALRRAVGWLIDPETAEVNWWHVEVIDPYGDYTDLPPHYQCTGREHFARAPGTGVWIASGDLPEATHKRLCEIHSSR